MLRPGVSGEEAKEVRLGILGSQSGERCVERRQRAWKAGTAERAGLGK